MRLPATLAIGLTLMGTGLHAQVVLSPDTTVDLGGTTFDDGDAVVDGGTPAAVSIQYPLGLPAGSDLVAFDAEDGAAYFSTDTTIALPGGVTAGPDMVVREQGGAFTVVFDGSVLAPGVAVDAVDVQSNGDLVLSFDTTVASGSLTFDDEDLARWDGATLSLELDASAHGVPAALDVDGAAVLGAGIVHLSFDGSGSIGGVSFDDEDVLSLDTGGSSWALVYDGSLAHASLSAADVVAVPEPALPSTLGAAVTLLFGLFARRARLQEVSWPRRSSPPRPRPGWSGSSPTRSPPS